MTTIGQVEDAVRALDYRMEKLGELCRAHDHPADKWLRNILNDAADKCERAACRMQRRMRTATLGPGDPGPETHENG
jgi:hypothetical protein